MTLGDIATKARALVGADTVSYSDANLLIDINIWYQKVVTMILESSDDSDFDDARKTNYPIQTTAMVAGQRDYSMPVSEKVLKIKRVDICYDGTNTYRATEFDTGAYQGGITFDNASSTDANFDANFIRTEPKYDVAYNSIWIAPMPTATDVANGGFIRVEWSRQITPFTTSDYSSVLTDSTVVPGFDDPFHPMLAYGAASEYATPKQLPALTAIQGGLSDYETRLRQHYSRKNIDSRLSFGTPDYTINYR